MGSFNTACAITGVPIIPGQPVKLFLLVQGGSYKGTLAGGSICYPWDQYQFLGLPMNAVYADYNNYEISEESEWALEGNLKVLKEKYVMNVVEEGKTLKDYNEYHDHMLVQKEDLEWGKVEGMIHSDRFFIKNWRGKALVHVMAIPIEVYNSFMEGSIEFWREGIVLNNCKEFVDYKMEKFNKNKVEGDESFKNLRETLMEKLGKTITPQNGEPYVMTQERIDSSLESYKKVLSFREQNERMEWMYDFYSIRDHIGFNEDFLRSIYELEFMATQMMVRNHVIRPTMLSGQEWDFQGHGDYLLGLAHAVKSMKYRHDDENLPLENIIKVESIYQIKYSVLKSTVEGWWPDDEKIKSEFDAILVDAGDSDVFEVTLDYKSDLPYMSLLYDNSGLDQGKVIKILMKE